MFNWLKKFFNYNQSAFPLALNLQRQLISYDRLVNESYLNNPIVFRAVNLISSNVASIPIQVLAQNVEVKDSWLSEVLTKNIIEEICFFLLLHGNVFLELIPGNNKHHQDFKLLRPDKIIINTNKDSNKVLSYSFQEESRTRHILAEKILHIKNFHPLNDWYGASPTQVAYMSTAQHNAVAQHNLALLQNGARPSGALLLKNNFLTESQRKDLKQQILESYQGTNNCGRIMVLEGDFVWQNMAVNPRDLDFFTGKSLAANEISQIFGIPSILLGIGKFHSDSAYSESRLHFWDSTIFPTLEKILKFFNSYLKDQGLRLTFDRENARPKGKKNK